MSKKSLIQLIDVQKTYDAGEVKVRALKGIDLEVVEGELVAIMGTSGSGKSTLMNLLGCLDRPTAGTYLLCGTDVSRLRRDQLAAIRNDQIGFVFQGFNLLKRTSALENVMLPLLYSRRFKPKQREPQARELLQRFGLGERIDHHPNQLSGGQQQRVAIARALVNEPKILLADEPTGNLDTRTGLEILAEFQRLNAEQGQTIVMVTHDRDIANCCNRQVIVQDGLVLSDQETVHPRDAAAELAQLGKKPIRSAPLEYVT